MSERYPAPDLKLCMQEFERVEIGEGYPYETLARAESYSEGDYHVYVVFLHEAVKDKYPHKIGDNPELPALYVGQTALSPKIRYEQHKAGIHASRYVRDYGKELASGIYGFYNPLPTRVEAEKVEEALAEFLRGLGYTVFGGH